MQIISWILIFIILAILGYSLKENFTNDIFYSSSIRLRDYQDVLSITESQAIKTN
jgi:hypothetical protein